MEYEVTKLAREKLQIFEERRKFRIKVIYTSFCIILIILVILSLMTGLPQYAVWSKRLHGQAELAQAESNRKIRILEAHAEEEASKSLSEAEVIRAEGVARANKIIGSSLKDNEGYLRYLWIQGLQQKDHQVLYVPTEANLPILEAGKRP